MIIAILKAAETPLTITPESHIAGQPMDFVAELLLKLVVGWIKAHPHSAISRYMLRPSGPRTDVAAMSRMQRLASALAFLLWGCLFLGLWLLAAYLIFGLGFLSPDDALVQTLIFGLALLAGCGLLGGLYLILRGVF